MCWQPAYVRALNVVYGFYQNKSTSIQVLTGQNSVIMKLASHKVLVPINDKLRL